MRAKKAAAEPKKNKGGRPKKDEARRFAKPTGIRFLPEETEAFNREAEKRGLPMTTWLRNLGRKASGLPT